MPLINVRISSSNVTNANLLLKELSNQLASSTGKPEKYVMCLLQTEVPMTFSGSDDPCCYVEIKSIGSLQPSQMTESFCSLIESKTGIPSNRIYVNFEDVDATKWGYDRQTFG